MLIPSGLSVRVVDVDDDYILVEFTVADGMFAGTTSLYSGELALAELSAGLGGFPSHPGERREIVLGSRDAGVADGWARVECNCLDRSGHIVLDIAILDKAVRGRSEVRECRVHLPVEAAALDAFAAELRQLPTEMGAEATLGRAV